MSQEITRVEIWKSNENRREVHFFSSANRSDYVMGYNPELFDKEVIIKLLNNAGFVVQYYED